MAPTPTAPADRSLRLSADWVLPVSAAPIREGAVLVDRVGRIAAVGPDQAVPRPDGIPTLHLAGATLTPGLVNTHTHLELTGLSGSVDPAVPFASWIRALRRQKDVRGPDDSLAAARRGVAAALAAGITTVADTGDSGAVIQALAEVGGSGIVYQEVFGPAPDQAEESLAALRAAVDRLARFAGPRLRLGVSPHAPYSVSGPLYRAVAGYAAAEGLPIAVHLAESAAESELLASGTGPFAEMWQRRGIPLPSDPAHLPPGSGPVSPVGWLDHHGVLGPRTLCIHLVRASANDIARLADRGVAVIHCPVSNDRHGHGVAPVAELRAAGLRLGVGTDSEVSVGHPDLFAEAALVRHRLGLSAAETLSLLTRDGAAALGLEGEVGVVAPGAWADLAAVATGPVPDDPTEPVLAAGHGGVREVWLGGRRVRGA